MAKLADELKELSLQERIKRLKLIEEERKKEIEEAEELIKQTTREISEAEEKRKVPIPQVKASDLSTLTTLEEKQIFHVARQVPAAQAATSEHEATPAAGRQQANLEEVAREEAKKHEAQQFQKPVYGDELQKARNPVELYHSDSLRTTTGSQASIKERLEEFYEKKSVTEAAVKREPSSAQEEYFGRAQQVTGGYRTARMEQEEHEQRVRVYRRTAAPGG